MIWLDMDMPPNCGYCEFNVLFEDGKCGCMQMVEDNGYGMPLITNPTKRLSDCPLHPLDDTVVKLILKRWQELDNQYERIRGEMRILEKYLGNYIKE